MVTILLPLSWRQHFQEFGFLVANQIQFRFFMVCTIDHHDTIQLNLGASFGSLAIGCNMQERLHAESFTILMLIANERSIFARLKSLIRLIT